MTREELKRYKTSITQLLFFYKEKEKYNTTSGHSPAVCIKVTERWQVTGGRRGKGGGVEERGRQAGGR